MPDVAVIMGSASDEEKTRPCLDVLDDLGISYIFTIASAHRTPTRIERLAREAEANGVKVFICAAGMAAHLAGAVAARVVCPVIAIPLSGSALNGLDALFSTVQMPAGFPVATVALDKAGAKNAAWLAAQILAINDGRLLEKLRQYRDKMTAEVESAARALENKNSATVWV